MRGNATYRRLSDWSSCLHGYPCHLRHVLSHMHYFKRHILHLGQRPCRRSVKAHGPHVVLPKRPEPPPKHPIPRIGGNPNNGGKREEHHRKPTTAFKNPAIIRTARSSDPSRQTPSHTGCRPVCPRKCCFPQRQPCCRKH